MLVLKHVGVEGFASFDHVEVDLGKLTLIVGPNGAGKSNFINVFELLGQIIRGELGISVGKSGGSSRLLHSTSRRAERLVLRTEFDRNGYDIVLVPGVDDQLVFEAEVPWFKGDIVSIVKRPLGSGHRESKLASSDESVARFVLNRMRQWVVYHFHDTGPQAPVKQKGDLGDNVTLRHDASNLAAFLYRLRETERASYDRIVDAVRSVAPFFDDFNLKPDVLNTERIQLDWSQQGTSAYFGPAALSDGTLRFMCIATLLLQPDPPSLVLLDEPELGLHPYAINLVAEMLATTDCQVIVSTQSVTLLNQMDIGDVLIAEQHDGATRLERPDLDRLDAWLDDYGLGEVWEKNLLGGRPVQN